MILGDVEETVTTVEIDEETYEEIYKVSSSVFSIFACVRAFPGRAVCVCACSIARSK